MLHVWWSRPSALWRADRGLEPRHHIRALRIFPLLLLLALINSNYSLIFLFDSCSCKVLYAKLHQLKQIHPVTSLPDISGYFVSLANREDSISTNPLLKQICIIWKSFATFYCRWANMPSNQSSSHRTPPSPLPPPTDNSLHRNSPRSTYETGSNDPLKWLNDFTHNATANHNTMDSKN
ncbi:hypothetical protein HZ326_27518 [Fusarium oxysporum f. sp. albedinis]|nr:hypothetical protein HZ326_27518 [Fusarium oxysporum f. sp. albedinis]